MRCNLIDKASMVTSFLKAAVALTENPIIVKGVAWWVFATARMQGTVFGIA